MPDLITEEIVHIKGYPKRLVVFLHGYIDSSEATDKSIAPLIERLDDVAVHMPQSPFTCEIHPNKRQWYSMHRFDPNDDRKTVPTLEECVAYYDRMSPGYREAFDYINPYIDRCLDEYQLEDRDLYLCGFSQGAMLAIYISLMRERKIGGCISFSGIFAPSSYLLAHANSAQDMLLIHGNDDNLVRFEALDFSERNLRRLGCNVQTYVIEGGRHRVTEDALDAAAAYLRSRFKETAAE